MFIYHLFKNINYNAHVAVWYGIFILILSGGSIVYAFTSFLGFLCIWCLLDGIVGYCKERRKSPTLKK